jgi:hypothetical protein
VAKLKADMTVNNPDAEQMLDKLGNHAHAIPYLALFTPKQPDRPITFEGWYTKADLLERIRQLPVSKPQPLSGRTERQLPPEAPDGAERLPITLSSQSAAPPRLASELAPKGTRPSPATLPLPSASPTESLSWRPFDPKSIEEFRAKRVNLLIDWTADW